MSEDQPTVACESGGAAVAVLPQVGRDAAHLGIVAARPWRTRLLGLVRVVSQIALYPLILVLAIAGMRMAGYDVSLVVSNSMSPVFERGDIVLVKLKESEEPVTPGLVAVFEPRVAGRVLPAFMHRIIESDNLGGWITKGDALEDSDPWRVSESDVRGFIVGSVATRFITTETFRVACGSMLGAIAGVWLLRRRIFPDDDSTKATNPGHGAEDNSDDAVDTAKSGAVT